MDELLAASLCRSPQALAQAEDQAKLASSRNVGALEDAHRIVEDAIYTGRWTDDDAQAIREVMMHLTRAQQDEVLRILVPALQSELEVDSYPPF
jgi:putative intracellular protease/amidase